MPRSVYQQEQQQQHKEEEELQQQQSKKIVVPPPPPRIKPLINNNNISEVNLTTTTTTALTTIIEVDISECKRELKRIQNRRAIIIASRLADDPLLIHLQQQLGKLETEISKFRTLKTRDNIEAIRVDSIKSEFYCYDDDNNNNNNAYSRLMPRNQTMLLLEDLLLFLDSKRGEFKEQVYYYCYITL